MKQLSNCIVYSPLGYFQDNGRGGGGGACKRIVKWGKKGEGSNRYLISGACEKGRVPDG